MDSYFDVLIDRLKLVSYVSGESALKLDIFHRLGNVLIQYSLSPAKFVLSNENIQVLRIFLVDWDRSVRSLCFRIFRIALNFVDAYALLSSSIDVLTVIRLESSKSHVERVAIVRFIAKWVSVSNSERMVSYFLRSINELIFGNLPGDMSSFALSLVDLSISIQRRFPHMALCGIRQFLEGIFPHLRDKRKDHLLELVVYICTECSQVVAISESVITPIVFKRFMESTIGIHILSVSTSPEFICNPLDGFVYVKIILERLSGNELVDAILEYTKQLDLLPLLVRLIKTEVQHSSNRIGQIELFTSLFKRIDPSLELNLFPTYMHRFEELVCAVPQIQVNLNETNRPSILYSASPFGTVVTGQLLCEQDQKLLIEITSLGSLVQLKTKFYTLSTKRIKNPTLFRSVNLWYIVQDRMRHGQFNLQTKRFIHGLFVHIFCDQTSFGMLDKLAHSQ